MSGERRRQDRFATHFDIRFAKRSEAARALKAWSVNFSAGGLCVRAQTAFAPGDDVTMSLSIEGEQFELAGEIAWVRGDVVGVRFVGLEPGERARLEAVARSLAGRQPALT
jgi:uncharacterized protein (TIGR02266 family)